MTHAPYATTVLPATPVTARAAAKVLARAFADDPTIALFVRPGVPGRHRRLTQMFLAEIHMSGLDQVDTLVRRDTGQVLGAAVWKSPEHVVDRWDAARWYLAWAYSLRTGGMKIARGFGRAAAAHEPDGPHWQLLDLGASPAARGLGVGSALLQHRLTRVDAEGLPAQLMATTPGSRQLYERFGFTQVGRLPRVVGGAYAMVRPAHV